MKKTVLFLLATILITSACSKDQRIHRQLDGSWYATVNENIIISPQMRYEYTFDKERKGKGTGYFTIEYPGYFSKTNFTYEIDSQVLKMMVQDTTGAIVTSNLKVEGHNKTKMVFVNTENGKTTSLRAIKS